MISALICTLDDERRLAGTLSALVPAAVDGLVRQVVVVDAGSRDATLEIADDAGALLVRNGLPAALGAALQPWVLVLDPGARLTPGWERPVHAHMTATPVRAGRIVLDQKGLLARALRPPKTVGILAPKAMAIGWKGGIAEMARVLRPVKLPIGAVLEP